MDRDLCPSTSLTVTRVMDRDLYPSTVSYLTLIIDRDLYTATVSALTLIIHRGLYPSTVSVLTRIMDLDRLSNIFTINILDNTHIVNACVSTIVRYVLELHSPKSINLKCFILSSVPLNYMLIESLTGVRLQPII